MAKLIMMKGLPASGKSTSVKQMLQDNGNWVRVNKDLLREMLHFNKWTGNNEKLTMKAEKELAKFFLKQNINVMVDDTNLGESHKDIWKNIATETKAVFGILEKGTSVEECIERELERKKVGTHVIYKMALQYSKLEKPELGFVICDIDGTVANCEHRLHYVNGETKDWKGFFSEMMNDSPIESTISLIEEYQDKGHKIIFVSARSEDYRKETIEWLASKIPSIKYLTLIMRGSHDKRPDTEVKQQIFDLYFKDKYDIEVIVDDRPSVIRMWKQNNLNVIDVGKGEEF